LDQFTSEIKPEGNSEKDLKKGESPQGFWRDMLETVLLAVALFLVLNTITSRVRVYNISMEPTLNQGYLLVVNKLAYKIGEPKHGDIIVFHYEGNKDQDYIKRVIGLPGDTVKVSNGTVEVNGTQLLEPYLSAPPAYEGTWTVPEGSLFVLGDNRNSSSDSHDWGFVNQDWVVGKAIMVYWPLDQIRLLSGPDLVNAAP